MLMHVVMYRCIDDEKCSGLILIRVCSRRRFYSSLLSASAPFLERLDERDKIDPYFNVREKEGRGPINPSVCNLTLNKCILNKKR